MGLWPKLYISMYTECKIISSYIISILELKQQVAIRFNINSFSASWHDTFSEGTQVKRVLFANGQTRISYLETEVASRHATVMLNCSEHHFRCKLCRAVSYHAKVTLIVCSVSQLCRQLRSLTCHNGFLSLNNLSFWTLTFHLAHTSFEHLQKLILSLGGDSKSYSFPSLFLCCK